MIVKLQKRLFTPTKTATFIKTLTNKECSILRNILIEDLFFTFENLKHHFLYKRKTFQISWDIIFQSVTIAVTTEPAMLDFNQKLTV